jgi:hypothetical protein
MRSVHGQMYMEILIKGFPRALKEQGRQMYTADDVCYLILQHGGHRQLDVAREKREITDTRRLAFYHLLSIPSYSKDPGTVRPLVVPLFVP